MKIIPFFYRFIFAYYNSINSSESIDNVNENQNSAMDIDATDEDGDTLIYSRWKLLGITNTLLDILLYIIYNIQMYKIVIDTNVLLSAFFSKRGSSFKLIKYLALKADTEELYNVISVPLALEFEEVLLRPKNRVKYDYFSEKEIRLIISDIIAISHRTKLHFLWRPFLKDTFDDKVLETAVNGQADAIITYNTNDLKGVKKYFDIEILTPAELFDKGVLK